MKETYYFPHDYNARNDEKILKLLQVQGAAGYGNYWMLVEMLYEAGGVLQLDYERIAFALRTNYEAVKSLLHDFELFEINKTKFTSKRVQENLLARKEKSVSARNAVLKRWSNTNVLRTQYECNTIKERKGKEIYREKKKFSPPTVEEVKRYILENNYSVDPIVFLKYFSENNWKDSKGNKVKNWKQKIITWQTHNLNNKPSKQPFPI